MIGGEIFEKDMENGFVACFFDILLDFLSGECELVWKAVSCAVVGDCDPVGRYRCGCFDYGGEAYCFQAVRLSRMR